MKILIRKCMALLAALILAAPAIVAADAPQKREMRSAWVATVWRLDWPNNTISSTGNATQIQRQKDDLITMLDSLQANNMNAINFQVRGRCDAFYKSSYEPWSSDLVDERGKDPGWDPLEFCVAECHKRGMECHAWINPYRYESVLNQWDGTPRAYRTEHPDWLLDVNGASILNPGKEEVIQRICDVASEIVTNYDVDGLLFDDYFYLSGTPASADADLYNAYKAAGGTLSQNDWRRDNVNRMVAAVYKAVKSAKPWARFGISPAGIACTNSTVARKYGVSPCPTGSDWQYNDIYSDPMAWISAHSLDYISPQIYWTIGYSTDYDKAAKWWSEIANKFNRHFYSSHSISSLTAASKAPGQSGVESDIQLMASGANSDSFEEYANEVRLNRNYSLDGAPGSIFYSVKYMYRIAPLFAHHLRKTVFNTKALVPAITWQPQSNPGNVANLSRSANKLSWTAKQNMRYTVYAVPTSVPQANFNREPEYLLGVTYEPSYTFDQKYLTGYNFAVCVLDRYGNEYSPIFVGAATKDLPAPTLTYPANDATVEMPFDFQWNSVADATNYIVEVAEDAAMSKLLYNVPVEATSASSDMFRDMPIDQVLYWRVRSCGNSYNDGVSAAQAFTARNLQITYPAKGQTGVELKPVITWSFGEREAQLQISTDDDFEARDIVLEATATGGKYAVPAYALSAYTTYYVRCLYTRNGESCISPVSDFTTLNMTPAVPTIVNPVAGGTLHSDEVIKVSPVEGVTALRLEVSASTSFPGRTSYINGAMDLTTGVDNKTGGDIRISNKALTEGTTYYARTRGTYNSEDGVLTTEYSPVVQFTYSAQAGAADITADSDEATLTYSDGVLTIRHNGHATVKVYTATGALVAVLFDGDVNGTATTAVELESGIYLFTINDTTTVKVAI